VIGMQEDIVFIDEDTLTDEEKGDMLYEQTEE